MEEKRSLIADKEKFITEELRLTRERLSKNIDKLPNEELPHMEPHLRSLYFETYFLVVNEYNNAALVLCGILLESTLKEKLSMDGVTHEEIEKLNFGSAISEAKKRSLLEEKELIFLDKKRDELRNPYAHNNRFKLTKGVEFVTWKIPNAVEKLIALGERVSKGEITEEEVKKELIKGIQPELMGAEEFSPIAHSAKVQLDKETALPVFLEIDKFVRDFAVKHFTPNKN